MNKETFLEELEKLNIFLTEEQQNKFETYKELLKEYNNKFNLTSLTEDTDIYLKHFYDSLCITKASINENASILDIGTGAGFPGIPLSILYSNAKITLVESNGKKCSFLNVVKEKLNLTNITVINDRAENYIKNHRETFDIVTSRAVSHLKVLLELSIPALKLSGMFIPLKGVIEEELKSSEQLINKLNGKLNKVIEYSLPIENSKRTIPVFIKTSTTPLTFPRDYSKILKDLKK